MGILYLHQQPFLEDATERLARNPDIQAIAPTLQSAKLLNRRRRYSLGSLASELLQSEGMRILNPLESYQLLKKSIQEIIQPRDLEGTLKTWQPALRELLQTSPDLKKLAAINSQKIQQLSQVIEHYQGRLREQQVVDAAEIFWQAIALNPEPQSLCIYGYFDPRNDEFAFIQKVAAKDSIFYLPWVTDHHLFKRQGEILAKFQAQGWEVNHAEPKEKNLGDRLTQQFLATDKKAWNTEGLTQIQAHVYPNAEEEVRGTLRQIKKLLQQGIPARDIAIVTHQDTEWGALFLDVAWEYEIPLSLPNAIPLNKTRLGAWLRHFFGAIADNFSFEITARWLSHPLSNPLGANFWQIAQKERPNHLVSWQILIEEYCGLNFNLPIFQPPKKLPRKEWQKDLLNLVETFDLRRAAITWATEMVAYKKFIDALENLSKSSNEEITWADFLEELQILLELTTTPTYPIRGGVGLHNPQNLIGAKYQYLFVLDMAEGILPCPLKNEVILDFYTRNLLSESYAIEGAIAQAQREQLIFYYLLLIPTQKITFSYSAIGKNKPTSQSPSTYFSALGLNPSPPSEIILASVEEAQQLYLTHSRVPDILKSAPFQRAIAAHQIEKKRLYKIELDEYQGYVNQSFDIEQHTFSASQLINLGQCPFKWFAAKVLELSELAEPTTELEPSLKGKIYHKVLELALAAYQKNQELDLTNLSQLEQWLLEAEKALDLPKITGWEKQRVEHLQTLQRAIAAPEFLPENRSVFRLEEKAHFTWQGFKMTGQIDRLDLTEQDELVVIDYKSGATSPNGIQDEFGQLTIDLQLPIYEAAAQAIHPKKTVKNALYFSIKKAGIFKKNKQEEIDWNHIGDRLKHFLQEGSYPVAPDLQYKACQYCQFESVCRIKKTSSEG